MILQGKTNLEFIHHDETIGFQYEEHKSGESFTAGFWDIGGNDACQMVLPAII